MYILYHVCTGHRRHNDHLSNGLCWHWHSSPDGSLVDFGGCLHRSLLHRVWCGQQEARVCGGSELMLMHKYIRSPRQMNCTIADIRLASRMLELPLLCIIIYSWMCSIKLPCTMRIYMYVRICMTSGRCVMPIASSRKQLRTVVLIGGII